MQARFELGPPAQMHPQQQAEDGSTGGKSDLALGERPVGLPAVPWQGQVLSAKPPLQANEGVKARRSIQPGGLSTTFKYSAFSGNTTLGTHQPSDVAAGGATAGGTPPQILLVAGHQQVAGGASPRLALLHPSSAGQEESCLAQLPVAGIAKPLAATSPSAALSLFWNAPAAEDAALQLPPAGPAQARAAKALRGSKTAVSGLLQAGRRRPIERHGSGVLVPGQRSVSLNMGPGASASGVSFSPPGAAAIGVSFSPPGAGASGVSFSPPEGSSASGAGASGVRGMGSGASGVSFSPSEGSSASGARTQSQRFSGESRVSFRCEASSTKAETSSESEDEDSLRQNASLPHRTAAAPRPKWGTPVQHGERAVSFPANYHSQLPRDDTLCTLEYPPAHSQRAESFPSNFQLPLPHLGGATSPGLQQAEVYWKATGSTYREGPHSQSPGADGARFPSTSSREAGDNERGYRRAAQHSQTPGPEGEVLSRGSSGDAGDDGLAHLEYKLRLIEAHRQLSAAHCGNFLCSLEKDLEAQRRRRAISVRTMSTPRLLQPQVTSAAPKKAAPAWRTASGGNFLDG